MKWYYAILIYLIGLALGITMIIFAYKALKDEDMQKQIEKAIEIERSKNGRRNNQQNR